MCLFIFPEGQPKQWKFIRAWQNGKIDRERETGIDRERQRERETDRQTETDIWKDRDIRKRTETDRYRGE